MKPGGATLQLPALVDVTAPSTCLTSQITPTPPLKQSLAVTFLPQARFLLFSASTGFTLNHHICH